MRSLFYFGEIYARCAPEAPHGGQRLLDAVQLCLQTLGFPGEGCSLVEEPLEDRWRAGASSGDALEVARRGGE